MKKSYIILILLFVSFTLFNCKETAEDKREKAIELMSAQTLGLAYLEEFKLDEAEKEFLKFIEMAPDDKLGYANLGLVYLRMGKYDEAEKQLFKAIKINQEDPDVRLLLATVYKMNNEPKKAISVLIETLKFAPDHTKTLYELSELYSVGSDAKSQKLRKDYLIQLVKFEPENIVPRLNLIDICIASGDIDKAIEQLEIIQKQSPKFPKEALDYFDQTYALLKNKNSEKAITPFMIFHNHMKVTSPYQIGIARLKGPGGTVIGFPLITYSQQNTTLVNDNIPILDVLKFTDITASAGLNVVSVIRNNNEVSKYPTHVEIADYDGDTDMDIYVGIYDIKSSSYKHFLFNNDMGQFSDVAKELGIKHEGIESSATFSDFNNDGFLDLFIVKEDGNVLYENKEKGVFEDVSNKAKISSKSGGVKALVFDIDHDGDLDIFETRSNANKMFRNNGDGTFTEQASKMGLAGEEGSYSNDAAFGDFDDDGDIDLFVVNKNANNILYENQRQGVFEDISKKTGLKGSKNSSAVVVGDYNNDGFLDLLVTSFNGMDTALYQNLSDGSFDKKESVNKIFKSLRDVTVFDADFFDFDNDGLLDIIIAGESKNKDKKGIFLYHNTGNESFEDVSNLLPETLKSGIQISLFDYNDDGDIDIVITGKNGGISMLRNDGGNKNHYVKIKLVGLRTGSAKNNFFGIGAKIEMRAGDLYQTKVVNNPNIYFGLGNRPKVDIVRITWTNGVPQNILQPGADQAIIESQVLKGSCPFLYTWNGEEYEFVKDITWRSALGMPLGIMGESTKYAFADASDDYIKIPGELLKPKDDLYAIQVTSELWETIYMDKIELVVVDHPDSVDVFVPEQFSPPPFPGLQIHTVGKKSFPVSATDSKGADLLNYLVEKDHKYISNFISGKYQGLTSIHDLILDPGNSIDTKKLFIYLNGWIFPTDSSINFALAQSDELNVISPVIQVINKKGEWETVVPNLGFPMGKDKTVIADLSGKFLSSDHRIRILTNMEIYWDQIFFSDTSQNTSVDINIMDPVSAEIHYRGFSRTYRKGGRYGPHWFDYSTVDKNAKWRDLTGSYTRYGDVKPLLMESDNKYIISNAGDETSVQFNAKELPVLKNGWRRDYFIHSVGWVKDGDINTALGNTVLPLPFHGMKSYPPSKTDIYPDDPELQKYNKKYNTRKVTMETYRNSIKNIKN